MANDKKFIAKNGIQGLDASVFTSITTSGKVGVGTASPVAGLDVLGTSGYTGTIHNHLYASGEGVRIFGNEATLDLLGQDNGDHASSVYFRNGTEGFAWINDPDSNSFQLRSFTSTGDGFNAHGAGSAVSNLVSILDIGKTGEVIVNGESQISSAKLSVYGNQGIATTRTGNSSFIKMLVGSGGESRIDTANASRIMEVPSSGSEVVFNNAGEDRDFRVESNTNANILFVDGGNDKVGIGTANPDALLHVQHTAVDTAFIVANRYNDTSTGSDFRAIFAVSEADPHSAGTTATIIGNHNRTMHIGSYFDVDGSTNAVGALTILASGNIGIGTANPNTMLTILSRGDTGGANTRVLELKNNGTAYNADALASYNANTSYDVANGATLTYHSRGTAAGNIMAHVAGVNGEPVLTDRIVRAASRSTGTALYNRTYFAWDGAGTAAADMDIASTQLLETVSATGQTGSAYALYANGDVMYKGSLTLGQADSASAHINSYELMTFNIDTDNDDTNRYFAWYTNGLSGNGTQRMILDEGGNLGIGTATPRRQLHVLGGTGDANTTTVRFGAATNTDTNHSPKIELPETVDGNADMIYGFSITGDGNSTNNLLFRGHNNSTGGTVALSIDRDTANVGIGTNDPGDDKLYVTGGRSRLEVQNVPNGVISSNAATVIEATEAQLQIIGVDTGSWASNFTLTNAPASGNNKHWTMHHTPASHPTVSNALQFNYLATNTVSNIGGDGTGAAAETKMTIANTGNVGIATETPSNVLHVHGADSGITVSAAASDRPHIRLVNGTAEMLRLSVNNLYGAIGDSSNSQRYMVFKNDFIGTNTQTAPNAQIHIGTAAAEGDATNPALQIGGANTYRLGFYTQAELGVIDAANGDSGLAIHTKTIGEAVRINADGEVGIGTNNPFGTIHTRADNTRIIFAPGATGANLAAQHRLEFWEGVPTDANSADANYAIEYDGTPNYGGDGALLFRGAGSASNQVFGGINRLGTAFFGIEGGSPNLGIGTTNPGGKLTSYTSATRFQSLQSATADLEIVSDNNTNPVALIKGTGTADLLNVFDNTTEVFTIIDGGNVGIGTTNPLDKLDIIGAIRAGVNDGTGGSKVLRQRYGTSNDTIASMGTMYSSGGWLLGYGIDPKSGASGYVSSFDNFSGKRTALEFTNTAMQIHYAPAQQTAIGSDITGLKTPFNFDLDDTKLTIYKESASATMLELHNYQADINGGGFNQGSFIDFKMTDNNATFTPQARIGMVVGDSDGGDGGIPSEGSGNFQIYTGNGTDATGGGSLDLHSRFGQNGRLKIFTPGNTTDGTFYSTVTIDNTGSSTWSRLRFDRSGTAKWGLALGTDDKFRISNLYTNGTAANPDDNCLVIDNNSDVGLGTGAPAAKLHVYGTAHFQSDSGVKIISATNNPTNGAIIYFSDNIPAQGQNGFIKYKHSDGSVIAGSNEQMVFGGDQPISDFLFEGDVHSTGDVVAYFSDPRLKDFHGNITGALDKVNSLGGYYFTENELAKEIGYRNDRMQVGVNADEVEAVLPEVVTTALVNENIPQDEVRDYKTVKYEKMVPLLIEAIKELTEQNMEMKQRLDKLEGEA